MKVTEQVRDVLFRSTVLGASLFLPEGQLERKLYTEVAKVLDAGGGRWDRKSKSHVFPESPESFLETVLLTGEAVSEKKKFEFFETPPHVVELVKHKVESFIDEHKLDRKRTAVLEPSIGEGALAKAFPFAQQILGFDLNPKMIEVASRIPNVSAKVADFLEVSDAGASFNIVAMNPPFSGLSDQRHVTHALRLLEGMSGPKCLVAIMSPCLLFRQDESSKRFRHLIGKGFFEVEHLPAGSFKSAGTNVNTILLSAKFVEACS